MTANEWRALALALTAAALVPQAAVAQAAAPSPAPSPASTPTPAAAPASTPAPATPASPASTQRIEITGQRGDDTAQRRQSTAAKIVIGREELERFGDANTLEVLKRLPGVTVPGAPGRGGNPRMRGMAGGYTQILGDGERIAPGFSLDSIPPEQIERIEILRAPTAETGARAIAGTINIVLREGFRKRLNDLNLTLAAEGDHVMPSLTWTRNETFGPWIANGSLSLSDRHTTTPSRNDRVDTDLATGLPVLARTGLFRSDDERRSLHASARLQWRDEQGTSLMLMPLLIASEGSTRGRGTIDQTLGATPPEFARSDTLTEGRFRLARLNANLNHRLGAGPRLQWRAGFSDAHWRGRQHRDEFDAADALSQTYDEDTDSRDRNASLSLKLASLLGDGHQAVGGVELERNRRVEGKTTLRNGVPQLTEFGENLAASSTRYALYAQDEWTINPQWSVHAGLRIEGITTRGEGADSSEGRNRSRVTTPLLHAVWKPSAGSRDQVRASLTRSYRAPTLGQLIGRPSINRVDPAPGPNSELSADNAGNPLLRPEVALGLDLAVERYLADGGVLSANLFVRRIGDLIRNVVALEDVSWSPGQPRYVSRPQNIGDALSRGVELEAKFRLDQLVDDGPRTEVRANLSLFSSRVDAVPGPDNRLAEQPGGTFNLGADQRLRGTPFTLGANVNHTPGYRTRLDADRIAVQSEKTVLDAYALWAINADTKLRLSLSNLLAPDTANTTRVQSQGLEQANRTTTRSWLNAQVRLEMKL